MPENFIEMAHLQSDRYIAAMQAGSTPSEFFKSPLEILTVSLLWDAVETYEGPKHRQ